MATSDAFYNDLLVDVNATLEEFGTTYKVRKQGDYDPDTLSKTDGAIRQVVGLVATQGFAGAITSAIAETNSFTLGKKTLLLSAGALPLAGEEVSVDGQWFPLSKLIPIKPADITVLYMLDVSR